MNPPSIKPVNGYHGKESNVKTTDKQNWKEIDDYSDRKSKTDLEVVVNVETKNDINIVQQQFEDPGDLSNNVEAIVNPKQTKYESSEKAFEETTVRCEAREKRRTYR